MAAGLLPMSVILRAVAARCASWMLALGLFGVVKGGLRRPGLGVMRYFWEVSGIERWAVMCVERSERVAVEGKVRV